jgi:hypothetical protein
MTFIWASAFSGSLKVGPGLETNVRDSQLSGVLAFLTAACAVVGDSAVTASAVINVSVRFMDGPFPWGVDDDVRRTSRIDEMRFVGVCPELFRA